MKQKLGFVLVVEHNDLEPKSTLLVESIRRYEALKLAPIYVVQPRTGPPPSKACLSSLAQNGAVFIFADLNREWRRHSMMNKVYASALVEELVENKVQTLVFLDSDVLVTSGPDGIELNGEEAVAVAPIAEWRLGQMGQPVDEPITQIWELVFDVCGVKWPPSWQISTMIDKRVIFPYFNSGVVAVQPTLGIFRKWRENANRLAQDERAHKIPENSRDYTFLDQTTLAGTLLAELPREKIRVLSHRYNYPLHAHNVMPEEVRAKALEDIHFVHYHGHFSNLYWMDDIQVSEPFKAWLLARIPFRPRLQLKRSNFIQLISHLASRFPFRPIHHRWMHYLPGFRRTVPYPSQR
jgi:lipopolysaccharide biosynthesis glycosyltransferase